MKKKDTKSFRQDEVLKALISLEYIFDGAMVEYYPINDTAQKIKNRENLDDLDRLEFAVWNRKLNKYAESVFRARIGEKWDEDEFELDGVPIRLKRIKNNYSFFKNPDTAFYYGGAFKLANPFDKYWKARFLLK